MITKKSTQSKLIKSEPRLKNAKNFMDFKSQKK